MRVIIYFPNHSQGLATSAQVLRDAIRAVKLGADVKSCAVPPSAYGRNAEHIKTLPLPGAGADLAIFLENIVEHPQLDAFKHRVLLPNPEWTTADVILRARHMDAFWHKTRFSLQQFSVRFPSSHHQYIGFTSPDPGVSVAQHASFCHFRGKSIHRNTQQLMDAWCMNPHWPLLKLQAYGRDCQLTVPAWLIHKNMRLRFGHLDRSEYIDELTQAGIHLCTSQVEGFGHYINESRAMGALIIAVDGPPMNELVDSSSGVLIPTSETRAMNLGTRHLIHPTQLQEAIERVLSMPTEEKQEIGRSASRRYLHDRQSFHSRLAECVESLAGRS